MKYLLTILVLCSMLYGNNVSNLDYTESTMIVYNLNGEKITFIHSEGILYSNSVMTFNAVDIRQLKDKSWVIFHLVDGNLKFTLLKSTWDIKERD